MTKTIKLSPEAIEVLYEFLTGFEKWAGENIKWGIFDNTLNLCIEDHYVQYLKEMPESSVGFEKYRLLLDFFETLEGL